MLNRSGSTILQAIALIGVTVVAATGISTARPERAPGLVVHEWGTFTSVADADGQAVEWRPLSGPSDLPCFVTMLSPLSEFKVAAKPIDQLGAMRATVRMETPVLYFYAPQPQEVSVNVRFPQGLITEWYPRAEVAKVTAPIRLVNQTGQIDWRQVAITPSATPSFKVEEGESHYYAARETDAAPISVGNDPEKFLFYRGLASFPVPITARVLDRRRIELGRTGTHEFRHLILFENRGGKLGYRVIDRLAGTAVVQSPELTSTFASLRRDLEALLAQQGLYAREAAAMVETWRDSWFEEGTRLLYIVPRDAVDQILPLRVTPAPEQVARVFVGRVEVFTPATLDDVERAIRATDLKTLIKYGRFVDPIIGVIQAKGGLAAADDERRIDAALRLVAAADTPEKQCPNAAAR
jgi:hypothetical protein